MIDTPQNHSFTMIQYKEWWKKYFSGHVFPLCSEANLLRLNSVLISPSSESNNMIPKPSNSSRNPLAVSYRPPPFISSSQLPSIISKRKTSKKDTREGNKEKEVASKGKCTILYVNSHYSMIKRYEKFYKIKWNPFDIEEKDENKRRSRLATKKIKFEDECMKNFLQVKAPRDKQREYLLPFKPLLL